MNAKKIIDILVIDDNPDMLQWFELLNNQSSPYHFHILQNELNIVPTLEKMKPDLIFLDISLNSLDGPLVASIIGGMENGNIPIVYISADKKNSKIIEVDDFILKPFTREMIFNKIKEKLS
jgi:two-component SAPR family response regulator